MNKKKRIVALVFALIILLSTVLGVLSLFAFASTPSLILGSGYGLTQADLPLTVDKGSADLTGITEEYTITITKASPEYQAEAVDSSYDAISVFGDADKITIAGINISSTKGFVVGDEINLNIENGIATARDRTSDTIYPRISSSIGGEVFTDAGSYEFVVDGTKLLYEGTAVTTVKNDTDGTDGSYEGIVVVDGVEIKKNSNYRDGDVIEIIMQEDYSSSTDKDIIISDRKITYKSSSTEIREIDRNDRVDVYITLLDENVNGAVNEDTLDAIITDGAFKSHSSSSNNSSVEFVNVGEENGRAKIGIIFRNVSFTGSGSNIEFRVSYYDTSGVKHEYNISETFNEYYLEQYVPDSGSDDDEEDDEEITWDPITPHIIVGSYSYGGTSVNAGDVIDLELNLENTSKNYDLDNIVMKITLPDGMSMTSGSNTYYFDRLNRGDDFSETASIQIMPNALPESHSISIEFSFQYIANDSRHNGSSTETIAIPVAQVDRFSVNNVEAPDSIYVGEEYPVSISFINKGQSSVYNVTATLTGMGANKSEFLGNVESGNEDSIDFYVMGEMAGMMNGEIEITYEDSNMNIKSIKYPIGIEVMEYEEYYPPGFDPYAPPEDFETDVPMEEEDSVINTALILCASVVTLITAYTSIMKVKAKRSEFADEDI